jgi:PAS domain-containing protein
VIYILSDTRMVKVGYTHNMRARMKAHRKKRPGLTLRWIAPGGLTEEETLLSVAHDVLGDSVGSPASEWFLAADGQWKEVRDAYCELTGAPREPLSSCDVEDVDLRVRELERELLQARERLREIERANEDIVRRAVEPYAKALAIVGLCGDDMMTAIKDNRDLCDYSADEMRWALRIVMEVTDGRTSAGAIAKASRLGRHD